MRSVFPSLLTRGGLVCTRSPLRCLGLIPDITPLQRLPLGKVGTKRFAAERQVKGCLDLLADLVAVAVVIVGIEM